jgi:(3S)-malyl-CoA thioesterase
VPAGGPRPWARLRRRRLQRLPRRGGLAAECAEGRDFGFDGKTLIHPAQIDITNAAFAPSPDEIDLARRQIAAYEEALREGQGVAVVDGKIVENLHVDTARATLAKAKAIASVEAA